MSKSKRQVKRRMGTKKRRVVRRKTQKRKQTKRRGGEQRPEFGREQTYRSLSADGAIDPQGVLQTRPDTPLGVEIGSSEPQKRRFSMPSVSFFNPFSKKPTQDKSIDADVKLTMINNIKRKIDAKKLIGESTDELEKQLADLQPNTETTSQQQGRATNFMGQYGNQ